MIFEFTDQAPISLCEADDNENEKPDTTAQRVLSSAIVKSHHIEVLLSRSWSCVACFKPATSLAHEILPCWQRPPVGPWIVDCAAPICVSAGPCRTDAMKTLKDGAKTASDLVLSDKRFHMQKVCEVCGKATGIKMCGGCNFVT